MNNFQDVSPYAPLFVATQAPLPTTISDFWTMVKEQQVELIFCVMNDNEVKFYKCKNILVVVFLDYAKKKKYNVYNCKR